MLNIFHVKIGNSAVVTKDVQPYEIVAGVPARHLKWKFPEYIRKQLLEIKWWDWSDEKIKKNKKFFTTYLSEAGSECLWVHSFPIFALK